MKQEYTQENATLSVRTALGQDVLLLDSMQGSEGISELYRFTLSMRSVSNELDAGKLLGKPVSVELKVGNDVRREMHGIISRFTYLGSDADFSFYTAEMVPDLWLMTLGRDRVIYQNQSAPEIVQALLQHYQIRFDNRLKAAYSKRDYCVRYDETAFDFFSRLLEDEGVSYFFQHAHGQSTLVLSDSNAAFTANPDASTLTVHGGGMQERAGLRTVNQFELNARVTVKSQAADDFNFLSPSTSLQALQQGRSGFGLDYAYPGGHAAVPDGAVQAQMRLEARQLEQLTGYGKSLCPHLAAGGRFTLESHVRADLNAEHVVRRVVHHADRTGYRNEFETFSPKTLFRPARSTPRPMVHGSHTARVVGPSGEEIWTDQHGRVKVHFPWDRLGKQDDKSSCWVRTSQMWAGQGWGSLFVPRIGQEVIVSYIDADPDRPLITGCVYNAEHATPVDLPAQSTQSTIRSRSSKSGTAGNELRFEDKINAEELYLHAQKDMRAEVENDLTTTVIAGNEVHAVQKGDRSIVVETGNESHKVKGTRSVEVTGDETHRNGAHFTQDVQGNYQLKVKGNLVIDVTGSVTISSAQSVGVKAGTDMTHKAGTNLTSEAGVAMKSKAGVALSQEAPKIDSKAAGMHGVEAGGVLSLKGALVKIN